MELKSFATQSPAVSQRNRYCCRFLCETSIILQSQQHPCYRIVAVFSSDHIESGSAVRVVADADAVVDAGLCICSIGLDQLKSGN